MTNLLRDPIWQFIGAALALIAIGISIYLYLLQRRRKSLSYRLLAETELLTVNEEVKGKIKILFEDRPIINAHLLVILVVNDGNVPITSLDFEKPLSFSFGADASILTAEIIDKSPKTLKPELKVYQRSVEINPTLLNSKDSITLKLLIAQYRGIVGIDARIVGVSEVRLIINRISGFSHLMYVLLGMAIAAVSDFLDEWLHTPTISVSLLLVLLITLVISWIIITESRRRTFKNKK